jgi:hypothetical protein
MKRWIQLYMAILFAVLTATTKVAGQPAWGIDVRPSLNFPTKLFLGNRLEPGFGFDAAVTYNIVEKVSAYCGWGWSLFPQYKTNGQALSVERTGMGFGFKFTQPVNDFNLKIYAKGGAVHQHINVQRSKEKSFNSDQRWGWQFEAGLSLPLDLGISLQPGLKYCTLGGNVNENGSINKFQLNDLSAGIVLSVRFGRKTK